MKYKKILASFFCFFWNSRNSLTLIKTRSAKIPHCEKIKDCQCLVAVRYECLLSLLLDISVV